VIEVKVAKTGRAWKFGFWSDMSLALEVLSICHILIRPFVGVKVVMHHSVHAVGVLVSELAF
jgi:hypothetical protein